MGTAHSAFGDFRDCKSCIGAGHGWCTIRRKCGGFASRTCLEDAEDERNFAESKVVELDSPDAMLPQIGGDNSFLAIFCHADSDGCSAKGIRHDAEIVADEFVGAAVIGYADCAVAVDLCEEQNVDLFPTFRFFAAGSSEGVDTTQVKDKVWMRKLLTEDEKKQLSLEDMNGLASKFVRAAFFGKGDAKAIADEARELISAKYENSKNELAANFYVEVMDKVLEDVNGGMPYISMEFHNIKKKLHAPEMFEEDSVEDLKIQFAILSTFTNTLISG